jgi:hypothetical protein
VLTVPCAALEADLEARDEALERAGASPSAARKHLSLCARALGPQHWLTRRAEIRLVGLSLCSRDDKNDKNRWSLAECERRIDGVWTWAVAVGRPPELRLKAEYELLSRRFFAQGDAQGAARCFKRALPPGRLVH